MAKKIREIIVRIASKTNPHFGCDPFQRPIDELINYGIVNIDKPKGPTSHQVSEYVQNILKIDKAGHSGTLDPHVTGVLPTALGRATRITEILLKSGKEYVALMHLHKPISEEELKAGFKKFTGPIRQLPPIRSNVKREIRTRNIYYVDVLEIDEKDVLFKIGCQSGTYIRKYIHDLGQYLNTGAHMVQLRRTKAGCFDESTLATLQDLLDALSLFKNGTEGFIRKIIQPIENAVLDLPKLWVLDSTVEPLCHGQNLKIPGISKFETMINKGDIVAVLSLKDELVALGISLMGSKDMLKDKGVAVKIHRVFMREGTYKIRK